MAILNFKTLELQNFQSVGNIKQTVRLDSEGLTLVLGSNSDSNGNHTRIGAGKTAILQALHYALFGTSLNDVKIPRLVNKFNDRQMFVAVEAEREGNLYRIERGRKPDIFRFYVNGVDSAAPALDEAQGTKKDTQKEIDRVFGISKAIFQHVMGLNTYVLPFLKLGAPLQRVIVEELFGITLVAERAAALKVIYDQTKRACADEELRLRAFIDTNLRIESAIKQAEDDGARWDLNQSNKINALMTEVERLSEVDVAAAIAVFDALDSWTASEREINTSLAEAQRALTDATRELRTLDATIAAGDVDDPAAGREIDRIQRDNDRNAARIIAHNAAIEKISAEIEALAPALANPDIESCETCGQELSSAEHIAAMVARVESKHRALVSSLESNRAGVLTLTAEIEQNTSDVALLKQVQAETNLARKQAADDARGAKPKWESIIADATADTDRLRASLIALGPRPVPTVRSREAAYQMKSDFERKAQELENEVTRENPNTVRIQSLRTTISIVDHTKLDALKLTLAHEEFVFNALTKKDSFIRKRLIDRNLAKLNARMIHYLNLLGLPHQAYFLDDLSVEIQLLGQDYDFPELSRGEGNKMVLATAWAFRDLWEDLNFSINLWWIDELLDSGHDDATAELSLEVLKGMCLTASKNVFLVSHREIFNGAIDRTLTATKKNNFTTFEYQ